MTRRLLSEEQAAELSARNRAAKLEQAKRSMGLGELAPRAPVDALAVLATKKRLLSPKARIPSENSECMAFIDWTELVSFRGRPLYDRVVKIANERGKAGVMTAILQAIGMRKGFPDYIVLAPAGRWAGLFLEAKKRDGGKVDPEQTEWRDRLIEFGYHAEICAGAIELIQATQRYFERAGCVTDGSFLDRTRVES